MSRVEQQDEALKWIAEKLDKIRREARAVGHLTMAERATKLYGYAERERTRLREEGLINEEA